MGLNQLLCKNDDEGVEMRGSELLAIIQVSINQAKRDSMFATAERLQEDYDALVYISNEEGDFNILVKR